MDSLIFDMGNYEAVLPADRRYCRNHMWCQQTIDGSWRFGFTSYAMRLMKDVYFLEWSVNAGDTLALKQQIGFIETSKAQSELFAPWVGLLVAFNPAALADPSVINVDNYGSGWLFEMTGTADGTLAVTEYHAFLDAGWENTQRILKGQI